MKKSIASVLFVLGAMVAVAPDRVWGQAVTPPAIGSYPGYGAVTGVNAATTDGSTGVVGTSTATTGRTYGVYGENASGPGAGVQGVGVTGVGGVSNRYAGVGVKGVALDTTQRNWGVWGQAYGAESIGVHGESFATDTTGYGVVGESTGGTGRGIGAFASANTGVNHGLYAATWSPQGYGIYAINNGDNNNGYAAYFNGRVHVAGTLSKASGSFLIDHPSDPEGKYLRHSFVESPDMMNVYNGNVVVGADGTAKVELPAYFEDLNADYRYQLTTIGGFAPVYVEKEIEGNSFKIAGAKPGMKVSWQVTGVRNDMYARKNRIKVEEMKAEADRGKYLNPTAFGKPAEQGIGYASVSEPPQAGGDVVAVNVR